MALRAKVTSIRCFHGAERMLTGILTHPSCTFMQCSILIVPTVQPEWRHRDIELFFTVLHSVVVTFGDSPHYLVPADYHYADVDPR